MLTWSALGQFGAHAVIDSRCLSCARVYVRARAQSPRCPVRCGPPILGAAFCCAALHARGGRGPLSDCASLPIPTLRLLCYPTLTSPQRPICTSSRAAPYIVCVLALISYFFVGMRVTKFVPLCLAAALLKLVIAFPSISAPATAADCLGLRFEKDTVSCRMCA